MPSSTSSSEQRRGLTRATWVLLALVVLILTGVELASRFVVAPRSAIQRRIATEKEAALHLSGGDVLFVGNSLLLWGVDVPQLRTSMQPEWRSHRLVVEATSFEDWMFGLKRLLDRGARPSAVFVVLSPAQLAQHTVLGDYFAHHLMALEDLPAVASSVDLHPTAVTSMALANQSVFFGLRGELRKALLFAFLPNLDKLFTLVNRTAEPSPVRLESQIRLLSRHLAELRELGRSRGLPVLLVIPPQMRSNELMQQTERLAKEQGVELVVPIAPGQLDATHFSDGFHLNSKGQNLFTPALAAHVRRALADYRNSGS
jgi:hypothetical protein